MTTHFADKILIAMPQITSRAFKKTVIYIHTDDNETGTTGFMINVPMDTAQATTWSAEVKWPHPDKIFHGGPVDQQIGYILHNPEYSLGHTVKLNNAVSYTGGHDIISDINKGEGPNLLMLTSGYCLWQPGQLEKEVASNEWVVANFDKDYFFQPLDKEHAWEFAVNVSAENEIKKLFEKVDINY